MLTPLRKKSMSRSTYAWYVCMLHRESSCTLARAMDKLDNRIMRRGIISS